MSGTWLPNPTHGTPARGPPSYVPHRMAPANNRNMGDVHRNTGPPQTRPRGGDHRSHPAVSVPTSSSPYQYPVSVGTIDEDGLDDFDRSILNGDNTQHYQAPSEHVGGSQKSANRGIYANSPPSSILTQRRRANDSYPRRPVPVSRQITRVSHTHEQARPSLRMEANRGDESARQLQEGRGPLQQDSALLLATPSPLAQPCRPELPSGAVKYPLQSSSAPRVVPSILNQQTPSSDIVLQSSLPPKNSSSPTVHTNFQNSAAPKTSSNAPTSATPAVQGIPLVSVSGNLPEKFGAVFPFKLFNAVQSKCFDIVYKTNDNVIVAAPTGSGKTAILELAICKLALERGDENLKIVYQAPTKALCAERARDWEKKFSHMSLKCAELTGDTGHFEMRKVGEASIIVTTPEKWDSVTRKWFDHRRLLQMVKLFLIDEVHILKDVRGATLEAVVSRMKTIGANVRFVALSATVPNSEDIAMWLGRNHTNQQLPAHRQTFGEEFRPVKLEKVVYGFQSNANPWQFDKLLDSKLPPLIAKHSQRKPILIFCFTRKSCETTASLLAEYISAQPESNLWPMPTRTIPMINQELQEMARFGVAFHHANLDFQDRIAVEQNFLKGQLGVICCTSTLAVGVNLPCHTVVLKNTVAFKDDSLEELCDIEVMQMLGRAGRPQFHDSATAIILTRASNKTRYEKMVSGQEILESTLHLNLIEHLNSEVCLETITNLSSAKAWLTGTFLSVRLRLNPKHYRITGGGSNPMEIEDRLAEICERDIRLLQETRLVTDGESFESTAYGRSMSKYMVEFTTMKMILEIPRAPCMGTLITALAQASEFKDFRLRPAEKALFREINQSPLILYPIKETITQTWHKVSLLIQAHLGQIQYGDSNENGKLRRQLLMEKTMIFERLQRLVRAVTDCKGYERDAIGVKTALELVRSLSAEAWEGRPTQLTQVPNIGPVGMRKLASKGVRTVHELADKTQDQIERIMSRQPPFGKKMKAQLELFPRLAIDLAVTGHKSQPRNKEEPAVLHISATIRYLNGKGPPNWGGKAPMLTLCGEIDDGRLVYFWRGGLKKFDGKSALELKFSVGLRHTEDVLTCHVSCEDIVGTMVSHTLDYQLPSPIRLPSRVNVPTQVPRPQQPHTRDSPDYIGDDGIDDSDLLLAEMATTNLANGCRSDSRASLPLVERYIRTEERPVEQQVPALPAEYRSDVGADEQQGADDKFLETQSVDREANFEPLQLPNGKWRCNHACSGDSRTKSGKPCIHRCCKEGLDKPRKRAPTRPKKRKFGVARDGDESGQLSRADNMVDAYYRATHHASPPAKRVKETTEEAPKILGGPAPSMTMRDWEEPDLDGMDIEYIDLSNIDEEAELFPTAHRDGSRADLALPKVLDVTTPPATDQVGFLQQQNWIDHPGQLSSTNQVLDLLTPALFGTSLPSSGALPTATLLNDLWGGGLARVDWDFRPSPFKEGSYDPMLSNGISKAFHEDISLFEELSAVTPVIESTKQQDPVHSSSLDPPEPISSSANTLPRGREGEPAWVAEFEDQELLESLRGYVTFV